MLFEALYHLFNLDIQFFIDWFSGSIFLLFGLIVLTYFFSNGKNVLKNTFILILVIFTWIQFQDLSGFIILGATFLALNYMLKMFLLKIAESTPSLADKMFLVNEVSFLILLIAYNLGFFG